MFHILKLYNPKCQSSDFRKSFDIFSQNIVFHGEGETVPNTRCLEVKEHTLTFSKHQKLSKSKNYS